MKAEQRIDKIIKNYAKDFRKKVENDYWSVLAEVNNEMRKEVFRIYDKYIDDFYSYKTTSYVRHGQGKVGTMTGYNLYKGLTVEAVNKGKSSYLFIRYSGDDMESKKYKWNPNDPDTVLEYILNGIRFPYYKNQDFTWTGNYKSQDFEYSGTLQEAIDEFDKKFYDIAFKKFIKKWNRLQWF